MRITIKEEDSSSGGGHASFRLQAATPQFAARLVFKQTGVTARLDRLSYASPAVDVNEHIASTLCRQYSLGLEQARDRVLYPVGSVAPRLRRKSVREKGIPVVEDLEAPHARRLRWIRFLAAGPDVPNAVTFSISTQTRARVGSVDKGTYT